MANFKTKLNPFQGTLQLVNSDGLLFFKASVANAAALPPSGNSTNDARIANDTGHLYVWSGSAWVDQGNTFDLDWSAITGGPISSPSQIDTAVTQAGNAVPNTRTVNGHALSSNVTVTKSDVSLGNVTDDAQLKASNLDTDGTLSANSDSKISSQKAAKTYIDAATNLGVVKIPSTIGGSINFPAVNSALSYPDSNDFNMSNGQFTIEFWVRFTSLPVGSIYVMSQIGGGFAFEIYFTGSNKLRIAYSNGSVYNESSSFGFVTNTWYHIAWVQTATVGKWFVNGSQLGSDFTVKTFPDSTDSMYIGGHAGAIQGLVGQMAEFRISKGVARYTTTFTPQQTPFVHDSFDSLLVHGVINGEDSTQKILTNVNSVTFSSTIYPFLTSLITSSDKNGNLENLNITLGEIEQSLPKAHRINTDTILTTNGSTSLIDAGTLKQNLTVDSGKTIDGRDISVDGTTLDGFNTSITAKADKVTSITDANTVLLVHADGANNSTSFIDASASAKTITANGNAKVSTVQYKFGGSAYLGDGSGDFLSIPASTDFAFGSGDFSIDFWIYPNSQANSPRVFSITATAGVNDLRILLFGTSSGDITFSCDVGGVSNVQFRTPGGVVSNGAWTHVEVTRNGSIYYVFINGVSQTLTLQAGSYSNALLTSSTAAYIGAQLSGTDSLNGYVEELRVSKGIARHTSNFTPPTSAYVIATYNRVAYFSPTGNLQDSTIDATKSDEILSGQLFTSITKTATSYTVLSSDCIIGVTSTASPRTITLPAPTTLRTGKLFIIKDESGGALINVITVNTASGNIDGVSSKAIITNYGAIFIYSDGTNYFTISSI